MASPSAPADPVAAYVATLIDALGNRVPLEVLAETPDALRHAVAGLSPAEEIAPEAPGKWSVRQVARHFADSEIVGAFRFRMVLAHDAPEVPGYDQDLWAERLDYQEADLPSSVADFAAFRTANLRILRRATPAQLARVMHHAERGDESLGKMIRMYAGHDLVHLRQIARIRRAIGAPPA